MVIENLSLIKEINCKFEDASPDEIIKSGDFFSGSIYYNDDRNSWVQFNLVNKEKISYILKELKPNTGVYFELQVYASNAKEIQ